VFTLYNYVKSHRYEGRPEKTKKASSDIGLSLSSPGKNVVEPRGIEPLTS
jgi:hypothetical protein